MDVGWLNGTRTVWEAGPGPFRATLTFRAGRQHEALPERGAAQVIAHTVLARLSRSATAVEAEIAPESTSFFAIGDPAEVIAVMTELAKALSSPGLRTPSTTGSTWALSAPELRVAALEEGVPAAFERPLDEVAHLLYGHTGVGRRHGPRPPLESITPARLADYARRYFHRDNAVLAMTGPPPQSSDFSLPEGTFPPYPAATSTGHPRGGVVAAGIDAAALAVELAHNASGIAALPVLVERMAQELTARGLRGPVYDPGVQVSRDRLLMTYAVECDPAEAARVAAGLVEGLRSVGARPPTVVELDRIAEASEARAHDPDHLNQRLDEAGAAFLADFGPKAVLEERSADPTPESVAAVVNDAMSQLVVLLPRNAPAAAHLPLPNHTGWRAPARPPIESGHVARRRRLGRHSRIDKVVCSDLGFTLHPTNGAPETMWWSEVAGVERDGANRRIHALDGRWQDIDASAVARPERLLTVVDERSGQLSWDIDPSQ